nr:pleiotropic drug resistance protein 1-like [Ipomoea batatas]
MDEPTSGLDARAATIVMRTVRNTVDTGRTVVCTIHQPSIDIFDAFDELLLLKRGGEEIYVGPLGRHCSQLIRYFETINGVQRIREGYNPATWMLEITSEAQEGALGIDFAEVYRNSELYRRNKALIQELSKPAPGSKDLYFPTAPTAPNSNITYTILQKIYQGYGVISKPLTEMLKKDAFKWSHEAEMDFAQLKSALFINPQNPLRPSSIAQLSSSAADQRFWRIDDNEALGLTTMLFAHNIRSYQRLASPDRRWKVLMEKMVDFNPISSRICCPKIGEGRSSKLPEP